MAKSQRILLVEDQAADIVLPYRLIQHMGFDVTLSFDGEQALNELKSASFDLMIMDWQMPILTGRDLLKKISTLPRRVRTPLAIVIFSGEDLSFEDITDSTNFEIIDIWRKPLRANEIALKIKDLSLFNTKIAS